MYLRYGNYSYGTGVARIDSLTRHRKVSDAGTIHGYTEQWRVSGEIQAASQSALTTALAALELAHSIQGQALGFFDDDGNPTAHGILDRQTVGGVRVVEGVNYPEGGGAEYSTYRKFEVVYEADIAYTNVGLLAWSETLTFDGGGPLIAHQVCVNAPPQKQILAAATPFHAVQVGSAVGHLSYPLPPGPLWPADLKKSPSVKRRSPKRWGNSFVEFPVDWEYEFEAVNPFIGFPTRQPNL